MNTQNGIIEREPASKKSFFFKIIVGIVIVAFLLCAIGFGFRYFLSTHTKTTKIGFEDIGELATQVAYCTEINVTTASRDLFGISIPFTQSKYIYSYDITIKAGLDFRDIHWFEDTATKTITVYLPPVHILSCEINPDSFELYLEDESIFRQITMEENNEALAQLKTTAEEDAIANGLLENARENAESILTVFFSNVYNPQEYNIVFTDER